MFIFNCSTIIYNSFKKIKSFLKNVYLFIFISCIVLCNLYGYLGISGGDYPELINERNDNLSIASEVQRIKNNIAVAYSACDSKGATMPTAQNSANLADTIDSISQGSDTEAEPKYVNFIDVDGTILYSYTEAEVQALSELPPFPERSGYTYRRWNWSLSDIKSYGFPLTVGAIRTPSDGMTHLTFCLLPGEDLTLSIPFSSYSHCSITIDWGDGSSASYTSSPATHTYAASGEYVVRADANDVFEMRQLSGYTALRLNKAEFGDRAAIRSNVLQNCFSVNMVSLPHTVNTINDYAFSHCFSLKSITIPDGCTAIKDSAFIHCTSLSSVSLPKETFCDIRCFDECFSLKSVFFPYNDSQSIIRSWTCYYCSSLRSVVIPPWITEIKSMAFYGASLLCYFDLSALTSVPTLEDTNAFQSIAGGYIIYVRNEQMRSAFAEATNWSALADRIQIGGKYAQT